MPALSMARPSVVHDYLLMNSLVIQLLQRNSLTSRTFPLSIRKVNTLVNSESWQSNRGLRVLGTLAGYHYRRKIDVRECLSKEKSKIEQAQILNSTVLQQQSELPLGKIRHRAGQLLAQVVWRPERDNVWLTSNQIATDSRSTVELRAPFVLACSAILFLRPAITWRRR